MGREADGSRCGEGRQDNTTRMHMHRPLSYNTENICKVFKCLTMLISISALLRNKLLGDGESHVF